MNIRSYADYQIFNIKDKKIVDVQGKMLEKLKALNPIMPDWKNKTVLDVGCDFGFWSFLAASKGATVLGIDRSRNVKGIGHVNLAKLNNEMAQEHGLDATFVEYNIGHNWIDLGTYDIVLCMSLYHHIYQSNGGDHESIWYWLWRSTNKQLIWENPTTIEDGVAKKDIEKKFHAEYNTKEIKKYASRYFEWEYEGEAYHKTTRVVWSLIPKILPKIEWSGPVRPTSGGGATKAFLYKEGRRIKEIASIIGVTPIPGSYNIRLNKDFDWSRKYIRGEILDVIKRVQNLNVPWKLRKIRFYPVMLQNDRAWVMRFEKENIPLHYIELISDKKLNKGEKNITFIQ